MKAKSKLLILLFTLALLCGILAVTASATDTTAGFGVTVNGETTNHEDKTTYADLVEYVNGMTSAAKITLYQDYTFDTTTALTFTKDGTELDLNGKTITMKSSGNIVSSTECTGAGVFIYSSVPGAQIVTEGNALNDGFIFQAKGNLTIGRAPNGGDTNPYKGNLTIAGTALINLRNTNTLKAVIDGIIYKNISGSSSGCVQVNGYSITAEIKNCDFVITRMALFGLRTNHTGNTVSVEGSRIYTTYKTGTDYLLVNRHGNCNTANAKGVTLKNTVIVSTAELSNTYGGEFPITLGEGVTMSHVNATLTKGDGLAVARTDATSDTIKVTVSGTETSYPYTTLYTAVNESKTVNVTTEDGVTTVWKIGATVPTSGLSHREGNIATIVTGLTLTDEGGTTVCTDGKIPETVAAGTTLIAKTTSVQKTIAVAFIAEDGTETYVDSTEDDATDGAAFMTAMDKLTESTEVVLYKNLTYNESNNATLVKDKTFKLDFNGYRLTVTAPPTYLFLANGAVYVYSSQPGGGVTGSGADRHFIAVTGGGSVTIGAYGEYPGSNFSISDMLVGYVMSNSLTIDGGTYSRTKGNRATLFYLQSSVAPVIKNATFLINLEGETDGHGVFRPTIEDKTNVTLENCNFYTNRTNVPLFHGLVSNGGKVTSLTVTIKGGNFYGFTLPKSDGNITTLAYKISNSPKFMAVAEGAAVDKTLVRINDAYLEGKTSSPVSYSLEDDESSSYLATFKYDGSEVEERWLAGSKPTYRADVFGTYYWYVAATEGIAAATEYPAKLKTTESKITGNLTLYANITFNLYFKNDGFIKGVKYNNVSHYFTEADEKSGYYYFPISDISPKNLSEAFTLEVILENGETTATYTVNTSLSKYAASVLASTESAAGKNLVMALLDYVYEMSIDPDLGGKDADSDGLKAIRKGLDYYKQSLNYEREEWDGTAPTPVKGNITDASLKLASTPGFIFYLDSTKYATAATVEVSINGVTKSYDVTTVEGSKPYIIVDDIHVSKYNDTMTVELDGVSFEYSLGAYMKGYTTIPEYAKALYNYVCAAKAYLEAQGN